MFRTGGRRKYHGYGQNHSYGYQMPETMEWKGRQVASCLKFTGGLLEGALEQLAAKPDSAPVMTPEERATVTETEFFTYKGWKMLPMAIPPSILFNNFGITAEMIENNTYTMPLVGEVRPLLQERLDSMLALIDLPLEEQKFGAFEITRVGAETGFDPSGCYQEEFDPNYVPPVQRSKAELQAEIDSDLVEVQNLIAESEAVLQSVWEDPTAYVAEADAQIARFTAEKLKFVQMDGAVVDGLTISKDIVIRTIQDYLNMVTTERDLVATSIYQEQQQLNEQQAARVAEAQERRQQQLAERRERLQQRLNVQAVRRQQHAAARESYQQVLETIQSQSNAPVNEQAAKNVAQQAYDETLQNVIVATNIAMQSNGSNIANGSNTTPANWGPKNTNEPVNKSVNANANANVLALQAKLNEEAEQQQQLIYAAIGVAGLGLLYAIFKK